MLKDMSVPDLAPIILFVYRRVDHARQTITLLQQNRLAQESDLIIFSDGHKSIEDKEGVNEVRAYIQDLQGFKSVQIIKREKNYGLAKNIVEGVSEVISKYQKVIVLEDDLLTSRNFLCFMNQTLSHYQDRDDIYAISGYTAPLKSLKTHKEDMYLSYRPSSWGWATWVEQWKDIDWDVTDFDTFIASKKQVNSFNRGGIDLARMLRHSIEGKNHSWAIRWFYAMYREGKYAIYPKVSKVQNIGFGGDATHCSGVDIYQTHLDTSDRCDLLFSDESRPDDVISREFRYQASYTNKLIKKTSGWLKERLGRMYA